MHSILFAVFFHLVASQTPAANLIPSFSTLAPSLPLSQPLPPNPYSYALVPNTGTWHSLTSATLKLRDHPDHPAPMLSTLNNNLHQLTCISFTTPAPALPHQLTFAYLLDASVFRAMLQVTLNQQVLFYRQVTRKYLQEESIVVGMKQGANLLCFEGSVEESAPEGVLVGDVGVVGFTGVQAGAQVWVGDAQQNEIVMGTNITIQSQQIYQLVLRQAKLSYNNCNLYPIGTTLNNSHLQYHFLSLSQYHHPSASISLALPAFTATLTQVLSPAPALLPRRFHVDATITALLQDSQQSIKILAYVISGMFKFVQLAGSSLLGVGYVGWVWVAGWVAGLGVGWVGPGVEGGVQAVTGVAMSSLVGLAGAMGSGVEGWRSVGVLGALEIGLIAVVNVAKICMFLTVVRRRNGGFYKRLQYKMQHHLIFQLLLFSLVFVHSGGSFIASSQGFRSPTARVTYSLIIGPIALVFFLPLVFTLSQLRTLHRCQPKPNSPQMLPYHLSIGLSLASNLTLPALAFLSGLGLVYPTLCLALLLTSVKLALHCRLTHRHRSPLNFSHLFCLLLQLIILVCYLLFQLCYSLDTLPAEVETGWMAMLRYCGVVIVYGVVVGGSVEAVAAGVGVLGVVRGYWHVLGGCNRVRDAEVQSRVNVEVEADGDEVATKDGGKKQEEKEEIREVEGQTDGRRGQQAEGQSNVRMFSAPQQSPKLSRKVHFTQNYPQQQKENTSLPPKRPLPQKSHFQPHLNSDQQLPPDPSPQSQPSPNPKSLSRISNSSGPIDKLEMRRRLKNLKLVKKLRLTKISEVSNSQAEQTEGRTAHQIELRGSNQENFS